MRIVLVVMLVALSWTVPGWTQEKIVSISELAGYSKPDREKMLYEGAKKEGAAMWYTSLTGGPDKQAPIRV